MAIYAVQTSRFLGSGRWAWEIHLEGDPAALDMVERVIYQLHPSFDPPVRISTDRLSGFQLATEGWGSFPVPVTAWLKDGSTLTWEVQLVFNY